MVMQEHAERQRSKLVKSDTLIPFPDKSEQKREKRDKENEEDKEEEDKEEEDEGEEQAEELC